MRKRKLSSLICFIVAFIVVFGSYGTAMAMDAPVAEDAAASDVQAPVDEVLPEDSAPVAEVVAEEPAAVVEEEPAAVIEEEPAAVVEEPAADEGAPIAPMSNVVNPSTLDAVSGIGYDPVEQRVYWNKVANASMYRLTITDGVGAASNYSLGVPYADVGGLADGPYAVSIYARNTRDVYLVASGLTMAQIYSGYPDYPDGYERTNYKEATQTYDLYKNPQGAAATSSFTKTSPASSTTTVSTLPGVSLKEVTETEALFQVVSGATLFEGESIEWYAANNPDFKSDSKQDWVATYFDDTYHVGAPASLYLSNFDPGETIYVRARVYNGNYAGTGDGFSPYTAAIAFVMPQITLTGVNTSVSATSITLSPSVSPGASYATGFEYARKSGKKWVSLGLYNSGYYVDKGLNKNTKYDYRVRAYKYNEKTGEQVWTAWKTVSATTWGANLNLKANAASKNSVKLSWTKIADADGYEIYRSDTDSYSDTSQNGLGLNNFSADLLVKTVKKSVKTYTDRRLNEGQVYYYTVRAYKMVGKQKCYISDMANVSLKARIMSPTMIAGYYTSSGSYKMDWQAQTGLQGYKVEKWDRVSGSYVELGALGAKATTFTAAAVAPGSESVDYRIRPYDAAKIYTGMLFTVEPRLPVVQNVKATALADGIQVTWSPVAGADYYQVYRTKAGAATLNKTTGAYSSSGGQVVYNAAINTDNLAYGYNSVGTYRTTRITATSMVDRKVTYKVRSTDSVGAYIPVGTDAYGKTIYQTEDYIFNAGPEAGVTWYYYVMAYADAPNGMVGVESFASAGQSQSSPAIMTALSAAKVSKITSVKSAKKGQATIKYKKVRGVSGYAIYRSASRNGVYSVVGTTKNASFTDAGLLSGKTYYYKVASYVGSESRSYVYSPLTAAKNVRVK